MTSFCTTRKCTTLWGEPDRLHVQNKQASKQTYMSHARVQYEVTLVWGSLMQARPNKGITVLVCTNNTTEVQWIKQKKYNKYWMTWIHV